MRYCWETNPKVGFFSKVFQTKFRIEKGGKGKRIDRGSSFESRGSMEGEEYEGYLGEFVVGTTSVPWGKEVG